MKAAGEPRPGLFQSVKNHPIPAHTSSSPARLAGLRHDSATPAAISDQPAPSSATAPTQDVPPNDPPGADRASASVSSPNPAPSTPSARAPARTLATVRQVPITTESWHGVGPIP